jgi:hypothetical protein
MEENARRGNCSSKGRITIGRNEGAHFGWGEWNTKQTGVCSGKMGLGILGLVGGEKCAIGEK